VKKNTAEEVAEKLGSASELCSSIFYPPPENSGILFQALERDSSPALLFSS
jgi:hypothetical protein